MTRPPTPNPLAGRSLRAPVLWGVVVGVIQAASPLGLWWLDPATVYGLSLTLIAAVYVVPASTGSWSASRCIAGSTVPA
jgi:hypothetical protein